MNGEGKSIKILHVDDEPDFLEVAKAFLKRENANFSIESATSAEEGLKCLKSDKYDVVVSDYQMPEIDGLEFLQRIRDSGNTIPFIIFTGKGREEVAMEALNKGANHYIQKGGDIKSQYGTLAHVIQETVEKRRADYKLSEIEKEHQIILNSLPLNIFHINRNSEFIHVNKALAERYGKDPRDFTGKSSRELFPDEAESFIRSDQEVLESGESQIGKVRKITTPEGERWVRLDKVPLKDADGNVTGIIGFELDITERQIAENRINHLNAVLRAIRDVNELITREKDKERLLKDTCEKLIKTGGYHTAWLALMDESGNFVSTAQAGFGDEFVPSEDTLKWDMLLNCAKKIFTQPGITVTENPFESSDCPLASYYKGRSAMAIRLEHRTNVYGVLEVALPPRMAMDEEEQALFKEVADDIAFALHDIETEAAHKVLAEALWEVKERYRILFESAKDGIFIEDLEGQIVDVNQTACEMLGYTADELTNLHVSDIVAPGVSVQQSNFIKEIQEMGFAFAQVDNVRKDGTQISMELSASIIALQDAPLVVVIARDITDRKQMEGHITRLNAMLRTLRNISELIVREKDRDPLLKGICEKLIETEGYHNAWIALMDAPGNFVSAAHAGVDEDKFLMAIDKVKRGELINCAKLSLVQSGILVTKNRSEVCSDCPLADQCEGGSGMSIRLEYGGKVYGVLVTSVASRVAMDEEEQVLFKECAGDIAFALHDFVIEAARQRAVDALLDSEEKYRTMVEYTGTGVAILEEDATVSFVNKEFERITGYTKEEVESTSWTNYIVNEDRDVMKQSSKAPAGAEIRFITKGGEIKDILLYETMIPGTRKSLTSLIDITQRKKAEEHIAHLYDNRRSIHEVNQLITREKDRDRMLTGVCKKLVKTRGYSTIRIALMDESGNFIGTKHAGLGKEFSKAIGNLKRGELLKCTQLSLAQPGIEVIENPSEVCAECPFASHCEGGSVMAIRLEHRGNVYGILTVSGPSKIVLDEEEQALLKEVADDIAFALYDIETEAAHTVLAEALWEVKERYRILFESAKEGIFIEDLEGGIVDANQTACEMLGYTYDEMTNLHVRNIVAPGSTVPQADFVRRIQEKGYAFAQGKNVRKDGTQISVEISASIIAMEDRPLVVVITHDITDRQQMEEHITRLNAMLRTLRNISELIVREKDRDQLIKVTCDKLIETEGYYNAWIALMDAPGNFESAAQAGLGDEFDSVIDMLKRGKLMSCAKKTLAQPGIWITETSSKACSHCPLASRCESKSGMSTRLEYGGKVYGILMTSVAHRVATDKEEQVLFKELADDIAFALHDFVIEAARQRAVDALLDSEEKYRTMVEYTGTGVAILEEDGTVSFMNKEFEKLTGYSKEEVEGTSWASYIVKEDLEVMKKSSETPAGSEIRLIAKSGEIKDILLNITIIPGTRKSLASLIDITTRKQIEKALQESEREHQTILDSVPVGLFHLDAESRFVRVNKSLAEGYGMTPEDFQGKTSKELFPGLGEEYIKSDREVLESGEPQANVMKKIKTIDGEKWVRLDKVPIKDAEGNVTGIIGFELDITTRIQAQEELRNAHKELQDIIEFLPDATFVIDRDKKVIAWNRAMEEMTGIKKEDIMGKGDYAYAVPFYGLARPILIDFVSSSTKEIEHHYEYITKEGNTSYAEAFAPSVYHGKGAHLWLTGTPLFDSDGNIVGAIESIRDITERKRAEEERERFLKELEAKNTEMERFTYTVSHDLRSPLFAIQGFTTLAREDLGQGKLENLANDLERTENAATKMDHLLNDTLQLSRVGRVANPPEDVPFAKIVKEALELVTAQIKASGVEVTTAEDFPTVHVDKVRIEEMLMNLIGNSVKYMGDQPSPKMEIGYRFEDGETVFFVEDNGIGIDPSLHKQVFELFYKVDKNSKGTGAGLAIVKRIIEVHGGRIWIESEKGKGCTVCFTLPMQ